MHKISLHEINHSEKTLTQAVFQVMQMLGIFHAELARILGLKCADITQLGNSQRRISADTKAWHEAEKLIKIYENLYQKYSGDEQAIYHWLRKHNRELQGVPLYLMVDELRIDDVLNVLTDHSI